MALVDYHAENRIGTIELNNPPVNSYSYESLQQLDQAICQARMDDEVDVLLLRGKGDKFFSAGADINMLAGKSTSFRYSFALYGQEVLLRLEHTPKLVIAAINGHAVGGGLEIAMACDIRIAKKDAGRMGVAEINLGVIPGMGGTQRLPRLVGKGRAMELCTTGRTIIFEEALEMGLVNHIYEPEGYWDQVLAYAKQFTTPNKASFAVGRVKRAIHVGLETSLEDGLAFEREVLHQAFNSQDATEGLAAYKDKRAPKFKGA
jgi:enoyl-CoA hydratase/carnithine racemase